MTDTSHPEYVLGHGAAERERLIRQSAFYAGLSEHFLRLAGLQPGMRVLDLGSGAGDVSFLASTLVGPSGSVVGVDMNPETVAHASRRAGELGIANVLFDAGDVTQLSYRGEFDAIIGRFIVLYLGDPVAGLRAFASYAKPGALICLQEFSPPGVWARPEVELYTKTLQLILETATRARIDLYIGMRLAEICRAAGLPNPTMLAQSRVEVGDSEAYDYVADTVRSLLPLVEKLGVATRAEVDVDTLGARLRAAAMEKQAVLHLPEIIGAWTRVP